MSLQNRIRFISESMPKMIANAGLEPAVLEFHCGENSALDPDSQQNCYSLPPHPSGHSPMDS